MSPIIFMAPFLAAAASLLTWGLVRVGFGRFGNNTRLRNYGCAAAALTFPIFTIVIYIGLPMAATSSGKGVTADVANASLMTFKVPLGATDVNFRHEYFSGLIDQADFNVDEKLFHEWSKQNGWAPTRFSMRDDGIHWDVAGDSQLPDQVFVTPVALENESRSDDLDVLNGYYFDDYEKDVFDDSGLTVVYDMDRGRAYIQRTTF